MMLNAPANCDVMLWWI